MTVMAKKPPEKHKLPAKNAANVRSDSDKLLRALIVLFILMGTAAALVAGLVVLRRVLFTSNPRFLLREVSVQSEGYWRDRSPALASRLGIHLGDNLFSIDPGELRRRLAAIPNVEHCEVTRILPDTLHLRIVERIPRAILSNPGGRFVVDEEGIVIPRRESMADKLPQLPVIFGFRSQIIEPGQKLDELAPALEVIMQAALNFPDIRIMVVDMRNPGKTVISMRFRDQKVCRVLIPAKDRDVNILLTALQSAILKAERSGNTRGIFDLSFDRNVIIR